MFFAVAYDHKHPLCTLVSKSNVTLAQPLRFKIMLCFTWKSLSGDRRLYLYATEMKLKVRCGCTDPCKTNAEFIVHSIITKKYQKYNTLIGQIAVRRPPFHKRNDVEWSRVSPAINLYLSVLSVLSSICFHKTLTNKFYLVKHLATELHQDNTPV